MFDQITCESIGYYVYALFDPRDPRIPFYVGKGINNRVFSHAAGEPGVESEDDALGPKLEKIREIRLRGDQVSHKIIRYRLTEEDAFKIEAALIDMVNCIVPETLTNRVSGHGVAEGFRDAVDLAIELGAKEADFAFPAMIIKIDRKWVGLIERHGNPSAVPEAAIWDAVRYHWKVSKARAERAECVLAVAKGIVRGVFNPTEWVASDRDGRLEMNGQSDAAKFQHLVGTSVSSRFEKGSQNPVKYVNF